MAESAIDDLKALGWSEAEARVYLALHQEGQPRTGYQCAKLARLPRANVYPALERLVRRGAVVEVPDQAATQYQAVPFAQLSKVVVASVQERLVAIGHALSGTPEQPRIARGRGRLAFLREGTGVIQEADRTVDVGASVGTVRPFAEALEDARARGVATAYYCFDRCPPPGCGVCVDPVPVGGGPFTLHGWLTLLADDRAAVVATNVGTDPEVLRTDLPPLVETLRLLFARLAKERPSR